MSKIKEFQAKITNLGDSIGIIVPAWIKHAFDVNKGDIVTVKLDKKQFAEYEPGKHINPSFYAKEPMEKSSKVSKPHFP